MQINYWKADQLIKNEESIKNNSNSAIQIIGVDVYSDFIEKAIVNHQKYKKHVENANRV